jgi:uncharacterized protein YyaL (SSP411 family)
MLPWRSKATGIVLIQTVRRCPINLRPFLGIRDGINTKGLGLFARASFARYRVSGNAAQLDEAVDLLHKLEQLSATGYAGPCWGYSFDWQSRTFFVPQNTPNVICTAYIGNAFLDAYETTGEARFLDIASDITGFIVNDLNRDESDGFCFSYTPLDNSRIFNASLWAAQFLLRVGSLRGDQGHFDIAERAIDYVVSAQLAEGGWYYGADTNQEWIDSYHTGYVIEALYTCWKLCGRPELEESATRGFDYFRHHFLQEGGTTKFHHDRLFPIDIHVQAQSILTLTKVGGASSLGSALSVAEWTIQNMQSPAGGFYYQKRKSWTNRTIHMRWGNAWMAYALSVLFESLIDDA